jgi:isoleucyl-tRNA synthetase
MDAKRKLTKTIVIRITEDQYRKLLNSIKFIPSHSNNEVNNKSQVIREMMDKYLVPKLS